MNFTGIRRGLLGVLAAALVYGQAPAPARPEFEVASIKPSAPLAANQARAGLRIDGAQVSCTAFSLNDLLGIAYRVRNYQISGPEWMASERFDINAKLPAASAAKELPEMFQALLEERFQMKMHREKRDLPVYGLVVGKGGLQMQQAPPDAATGAPNATGGVNVAVAGQSGGATVNYGNGAYFRLGSNQLVGHKLPPALMADVLARFADRPVIDMTELKGNYDFTLEFTPEDFRAMMIRSAVAAGVTLPPQALQLAEAASLDSLFSAVEKLGLKLEARKAPMEVLVIDHAEKTPTDN